MAFERLIRFFIEEALPVWADVAFDSTHGHFMEGLELDGTPDRSGIVRTRTAARQVYVHAHAAALGVAPEGALQKAETAFRSLHACTWNGGQDAGYARAINRLTNEITDPGKDLYDHACILLALAWLWKATAKDEYRRLAREAVAAMDVTLAAPHGGWAEDNDGKLPRRQNPHMHYFEACLAFCELGAADEYGARMDILFDLFRTRFFAGDEGPLREFFGLDWEASDDFNSDRLEPGHMVEWVWLVRRYAKLNGRNEDTLCETLLQTALAVGRDKNTPFLVDEASLEGTPLKETRRLWPQAELLKAYLMQDRALGGSRYRHKAVELTDALFHSYLAEAPRGCWRDCFDLDGTFVARSIPASSLYHLWTGVAELLGERTS